MSTDSYVLQRRRWLTWLATAGLTPVLSLPARAQSPSIPADTSGANPLTEGHGTGYHSPLSAFAPLPRREDVVAWSTLAQVGQRVERSRLVPVYAPEILSLHQKTLRLQGFMAPLDPGERQSTFLLSSVPLTCPFCSPGGAESIIQVIARSPIRYTMEGMVVEGRFHVLHNDSLGFFYRLTDAVAVR